MSHRRLSPGHHARGGGWARGSRALRWLLTLALLSAVTVAVVMLRDASSRGRAESAPRKTLSPWELLGCYELVVDPWNTEREVSGRSAEGPDHQRLMSGLRLPDEIMLRPDSLDEWGRPLGSYRVVPLAPVEESRTGSEEEPGTPPLPAATVPLRWYTRADTLWILGTIPGARVGIALFGAGDSLTGQARLVASAGARGAMAAARAWTINCATRTRQTSLDRPRR